MMQRQKSRYAPGTWQALVLKQHSNEHSITTHIDTSLALPFLLTLLRHERMRLHREWLLFLGMIATYYLLISSIKLLRGKDLPGPEVALTIALICLVKFGGPPEKRHTRWRNGLQEIFFHLKRSTISERLPVLLEIASWLHERPRLVTPETRQQFYTLLTETLSKTDTGVLETLEPKDVAALVALLTRQRKNTPETLLVAAILALSPLRPEKAELRQALNRLAYHSNQTVRVAVEEFYRAAK